MIENLQELNCPQRLQKLSPRESVLMAPKELLYIQSGMAGHVIYHHHIPMICRFMMPGNSAIGSSNDVPLSKILALTECELKIFDISNLTGSADQIAVIFNAFQEQATALQDHLICIANKTAVERLAKLVLDISGESTGEIQLPISRSQIADHLGLTIETISRSFSRLKSLGLIQFSSSASIRVKDVKGLRKLMVHGEKNSN